MYYFININSYFSKLQTYCDSEVIRFQELHADIFYYIINDNLIHLHMYLLSTYYGHCVKHLTNNSLPHNQCVMSPFSSHTRTSLSTLWCTLPSPSSWVRFPTWLRWNRWLKLQTCHFWVTIVVWTRPPALHKLYENLCNIISETQKQDFLSQASHIKAFSCRICSLCKLKKSAILFSTTLTP